ncbi:MAG: hypothetical protein LBD62_02065 [Candidatus Margulisbacteria bacterium]|jgi:hypothetical protein|nr:hypothetical protein [Candidatus Margulisiibacteriota bacterium]
MNYDRVLIVMTLLSALGMATIMDGIDGLGLGDNPVFPAVWRSSKRLDAGLTVKDDIRLSKGGKDTAKTKGIVSGPWVSWTDSLGKAYYSAGLFNGSYTSKYDNTVVGDNKLTFALAQDFGGIIAGFKAGYQSYSEKPRGAATTKYNPVTLSLGLAARLTDRQLVLLGYGTGLKYTRITNTKPKKTKMDITQGTDLALGYVYTASSALQLGAQFISSWTPDYDPFSSYSLAFSYLPVKEVELQGFLDMSVRVGANKKQDTSGANNAKYGVNAYWTPSAKIGTLGAGLSFDQMSGEDVRYTFSETIGTLFYSRLF